MFENLIKLLIDCGWDGAAKDDFAKVDQLGFIILANSLDIATEREEHPPEKRAAFVAARDEAARFAWPDDPDGGMRAMRDYRRSR